MAHLPTGTVTFLFTDIEGSTDLVRRLGERFQSVVDDHGRLLREAIALGGGSGVRTEGDSFFAVFPTATGALDAAVHAQRALGVHRWPDGERIRVRMGVHTGEGRLGGDDYVGMDVHVAARIAAAPSGGQVLLSAATASLLDHALPDDVTLRDLGSHRLKDIEHPVRLYQVVAEGLASEFPPIRTLDAPRTNLPVLRTSFIGRQREVDDAIEILDRSRLVTLTGPGGTGKTRLALEVGARLLERFGDGVFFADLSVVTDPALVLSAMAEALGVREEPGRAIADTLAGHLRDRDLLLILDNVEHVAEAAPGVGRLLDAAPALRVLATSRVPLHLSGESEYPVPPLGVPDPREPGGPDALSQFESVALFIDRATEVRPGFAVTNDNAPAVAEIAARLDGLPLAIELAASRIKVLDPDALLARLGQRLPLLTGDSRDRPERQQTLRATIDWSHDLLEEPERRLFASLSVFSGGCTLEAVEAVCGPGLDHDVLDGLTSLVDKSLVRRADANAGGLRFGMLGTVREYAAGRLEELGEGSAVAGRHGEFFRELVEEAEPHLTVDYHAGWLTRLDYEHDNIRAVLSRVVEDRDAETALRIGAAVWRFWQQRGHFTEGRIWLDRALSLPEADRRDPLRARALSALGGIAYWQNDYGPMGDAYREAAEIAREVGEPRLLGRALYDLAFVPLLSGAYADAEAILSESLEAARRSGDEGLVAEVVAYFGMITYFGGDSTGAVVRMEEAAEIHSRMGNRFLFADTMVGIGAVLLSMGDVAAAENRFRQGLRVMADAGVVVGVQGGLHALAMAAVRRGDPERAARLVGASTKIRDDAGGGVPPELIARFGDVEAEAKEALGEERYEQVLAQGYAMGRDAAVAYALTEDTESEVEG